MFIVGWSRDPAFCCCGFNSAVRGNTFYKTKEKPFHLFISEAANWICFSTLTLRCTTGLVVQVRRLELLVATLFTCCWPSLLCLLALICLKLQILNESNGTSGPRFNQIICLRCISICLSGQRWTQTPGSHGQTAAAGVWGCVAVKNDGKKRKMSGGFIIHTTLRASPLSSHFLHNHHSVLEPLFVPTAGSSQEGWWQNAPAECKASQQKAHLSWGCRQHPDDFLAPIVRWEASSSSCSALHFVFWNICPWLMAAMWAITAISQAHRKENLWICYREHIHSHMWLHVRDAHAFALINFYLFWHICCLSPCS